MVLLTRVSMNPSNSLDLCNMYPCLYQGGLDKKEMQLNLCNIFSFLIFNELYLFVNIRRVVTFMKYLASVVSLIFLAKTLVWNKIKFPASNLLNLAELAVN